jgi:hypothetical protein
VPPPARFSIVAPLPPHGEWRRALALDRSAAEPTAVVLAFVPQSVLDDGARLAAVVRDVEAAGRLHHPSAVPVLGTETIDEALAIVEAWRPGTTLRALLDAGGRLPPDVAVRVAVDACAAVASAHALDAGDGKRLVHGALAPSRIVVGDDGAALVTGFGTGVPAEAGDDVRALAAVLHECLAGEPPGAAPSSLEEARAPAALAAAVSRVLAAAPDAAPSAAALAGAVAAAGPVASHADVAAWVDAIAPRGEGARAELAGALAEAGVGGASGVADAEEVGEGDIVEATGPMARPAGAAGARPVEPTLEPLPRPPATRPGADPAGVFAAPARAEEARSRAPLVAAVVCWAIGMAGGYAGQRYVASAATATPTATPTATSTPTPTATATSTPTSTPTPTSTGTGTATPTATSTPTATATPTPKSSPKPKLKPPKRTASKSAAALKRGAKPASAPASTAAAAALGEGKGMLLVAAPSDAEVFLDERRIGRGNVHLEIPEGAHRIEVRLGESRVAESFTLAAGETWTYDVTPTSTP